MDGEDKQSLKAGSGDRILDLLDNDEENANLISSEDDSYSEVDFSNASFVSRKTHLLAIISAVVGISILVTVAKLNKFPKFPTPPPKSDERAVISLPEVSEFDLAKRQSYGLFDDIPNKDWEAMRERVKNHKNHLFFGRARNMHLPRVWYEENFEPNFTCPNDARVGYSGGVGNGMEWLCDPRRLTAQIRERKSKGGNGCLIYSVGNGRRFDFEKDIQNAIDEPCEIHSFDPNDYTESQFAPPNIHIHPWGIANSGIPEMPGRFKSLQETIDILDHHGHVIDIFRADCESCEWQTFRDWMDSDVSLMQVLVQVHNSPRVAFKFFETFQENGYVTFHKQKNLSQTGTVEYSMLKLTPKFFEF